MKTLSPLLLLILFWNTTLAQTPSMSFNSTVNDRGNIYYGESGVFKFPFQNTGTSPLIISTVKSSCGCLVPSWSKKLIQPGQWDTIYGKYDTRRLGTISKTLTVECNDTLERRIVLKIKGKVIPYPIVAIAIKVNETTTKPDEMNSITIGKSLKDSTLYSFSLINLSTKTRTISTAEYNSHLSKWGFYMAKSQPLLGELIMKPNETITLLILQNPSQSQGGYYRAPSLLIDGLELKFELK